MPALWEGCKRNEQAGSFAGTSEASSLRQAAMCPISPQRGGGGLFAAQQAARASEWRQMCLPGRAAQCPSQCRLCGEATAAPALPTPSDSQPPWSAAPCLLPPQGWSLTPPAIVFAMPKPSEARRGIIPFLLDWVIMGETYYVVGIAHSHPKPSAARRGILTSPCTSECTVLSSPCSTPPGRIC